MAKRKTKKALDEAAEKLESQENIQSSLISDNIPAENEVTNETFKNCSDINVNLDSWNTPEYEILDVVDDVIDEEDEDEIDDSPDYTINVGPVIPEPSYIEGETELESFNTKTATISGKCYPITRAQHKLLVAGDKSVIKEIVK